MKREINVKNHVRKTKKGFIPVNKHTKKIVKAKNKPKTSVGCIKKTPIRRKNYGYFLTETSDDMNRFLNQFEEDLSIDSLPMISGKEANALRSVAVKERKTLETAQAKKIRQDFKIKTGDAISDDEMKTLRSDLRDAGFKHVKRTAKNPTGYEEPEAELSLDDEEVFEDQPSDEYEEQTSDPDAADEKIKVEPYYD